MDGKTSNLTDSRTIGGSATTASNVIAASPPKALRAGPRVTAEPFPLDPTSPSPHYIISYSVDYDDIEFYEHLGSGRFGTVSRALLRSRNIVVAVKKVESLGQEVHILSQLSHRNIVRFYGVYSHVVSTPHNKQLQYGIVTEYCDNGSLYDLLKRIRPQISHNADCSETGLSFANIIQWASDIARGMNYLHSEAPVQILHRDLKSTNVLLSRDWMCKICDFGSSRTHRDNSIISVAGTPAWMSPELVRGEATFSSGCDVWSFGVVLWELLTCEQPFKGLDHYQIMFIVGSRSEHPPIPASCPASFQDLLNRCWAKEPTGRPMFSEIVVELAKMLSDDELPNEVAEFTSATARQMWLLEVEAELTRVKLMEQSLEEREHDIAERERQLEQKKKIVELQLSRLTPSASQAQLAQTSISGLERLDVLNWSEGEVARWVRQLDNSIDQLRGLGKYANLFEANHISGRRLLLLSKSDFHAMGITSLGHQKQFIDEINFLRLASQMVVDFPPLQITAVNNNNNNNNHNHYNGNSAMTPLANSHSAGEAVFQLGEESEKTSRRQSTSSLTNLAPTNPNLSYSSAAAGNGYHTPLSVNVSNSNSFILVENREFFVNIAVGMYSFPTTIAESGQVKESVEYRVFVDAHVSFDPSTVSSPDDAIAITDVDLTLDISNIFSSVFVIFDPDLPTARKICASVGVNESSINCPEYTAPYVAKESASAKLQQPFSAIEIEIALRPPYCCYNKTACIDKEDKELSSNTNTTTNTPDRSVRSSTTTEHSVIVTPPTPVRVTRVETAQESPGNNPSTKDSSFEFLGVIRKRLPADFNAPIQIWSECVTQLATRADDSVHFQLTSPMGDGSMSPTPGSSPHCTMTASSGRSMRAALRAAGVSGTPRSPRHLSLASMTSPINGEDPVTFFSDARRNSVSVTSPNERPSSPAAALIGQQVKAANDHHRLPYSLFQSSNHSSSSSLSGQPSVKTYASVAAASGSPDISSTGYTNLPHIAANGFHPHPNHHNHHHHYHLGQTRSETSVSPAHRHAIRNNQRQFRNGVAVGGGAGSGGSPRSQQNSSYAPRGGASRKA